MNFAPDDRIVVTYRTEGHGEYQTRWPEYEYRCPECGCYSNGSDISAIRDDGTESYCCPECAARILITEFSDKN